MDSEHARARNRLYGDPHRLEHYVVRVAERLGKSLEESRQWIDLMFHKNEYPLIDAVVHGVDVTGRIAYAEEPPRSLHGETCD
jgi:hypothetical protein